MAAVSGAMMERKEYYMPEVQSGMTLSRVLLTVDNRPGGDLVGEETRYVVVVEWGSTL